MTIGERIKEIRSKLGMSQVTFADKINVSKQTLYKYENNIITNIPSDKIEAIAHIGNVTPAYLMGWDTSLETPVSPGAVRIPVLGRVVAGIPINMITEILDWEEIPEKLANTGEFFALQIKGDSMEPRMKEGDVVIVKQQPDAESGDVVIAAVNGDEATCKRLMKYESGIALLSNNPNYIPMQFNNQDIQEKPVTILGKVVELRGKF